MYFGGCQPSASIFMEEQYCSIPKTEAASSSETVIPIYQTTWLLIPKDTAVNPYCRENPDSYNDRQKVHDATLQTAMR